MKFKPVFSILQVYFYKIKFKIVFQNDIFSINKYMNSMNYNKE